MMGMRTDEHLRAELNDKEGMDLHPRASLESSAKEQPSFMLPRRGE